MTIINCSFNCIYQNDGKCTLDNTAANSITASSDCIFFKEKAQGKEKEILTGTVLKK